MRRTVLLGWVQVALLCVALSGVQAQSLNGPAAAAPLEKTQWMLTWVDGVKVQGGSARPAYIELDPATHRLTGTGGCNQLLGTYVIEGDGLRLTGTARTMMACAVGMDTEGKLVKALEEVREWKVSGQQLVLLDGDHDVVAQFSAATAK